MTIQAGYSDWQGPTSEGPSPSASTMHPQVQQDRATHRVRKKLRESCNNCALSKVKCSKEQPVCARCEDREMYCHYSPTRRIGKRRAWSDNTGEKCTKTPWTLKDITPPEEQTYFNYLDPSLNHDLLLREEVMGNRNEEGNVSPLSLTGLTATHQHLQVQTGKAMGDNSSQITGAMLFESLDPNIFGDSNSTRSGLGYMLDHPGDITMATRTYEDQESLLNLITDDHGLNIPVSVSHCQNRELAPGTTNENHVDQPQSCINRALEILRKLHTSPPNCSLAASLNTNLVSSPPTRTIDQVLSTNKEILIVLYQILDCNCSLDIQVAFILTTIASKIISWYSAVALNNEDHSASSTPIGISTSPGTSLECVSHLPVTVGKYYLDGDNKSKMRAQLVLSELHLVLRLVEKLGARFKGIQVGERSTVGDGEAKDDQATSAPMFAELETFLRHRLRLMAKETTDMLRAS